MPEHLPGERLSRWNSKTRKTSQGEKTGKAITNLSRNWGGRALFSMSPGILTITLAKNNLSSAHCIEGKTKFQRQFQWKIIGQERERQVPGTEISSPICHFSAKRWFEEITGQGPLFASLSASVKSCSKISCLCSITPQASSSSANSRDGLRCWWGWTSERESI